MAPKKTPPGAELFAELRAFGLKYPGAHTKSPWPEHLDLAVKEKTFAYMNVNAEPLKISCKLPESHATALMLEFTSPTRYGLGKSGWVTAEFPIGYLPPIGMLKAWIDESYRAVAPKKLSASLSTSSRPAKPKPQPTAAGRKKSARSTAKKKP